MSAPLDRALVDEGRTLRALEEAAEGHRTVREERDGRERVVPPGL